MSNIFDINYYINHKAKDVLRLLPVEDLFSQATLTNKDSNKCFFEAKEALLDKNGLRKVAGKTVAL